MKASEAARAIHKTQPFLSGPLRGVRHSDRLYVISSYGQAIAAVVRDVGYLVTLEPASPTSGRQAGQVRAAWQGIYKDVTQDALDAAIRNV